MGRMPGRSRGRCGRSSSPDMPGRATSVTKTSNGSSRRRSTATSAVGTPRASYPSIATASSRTSRRRSSSSTMRILMFIHRAETLRFSQ
jgi:hypothetical protein